MAIITLLSCLILYQYFSIKESLLNRRLIAFELGAILGCVFAAIIGMYFWKDTPEQIVPLRRGRILNIPEIRVEQN